MFWKLPYSVWIRTQVSVEMFEQEKEGKTFNRTGKNNEKTNQRKFKSEKIYIGIKASKDEKVVGGQVQRWNSWTSI